MINKEMKKINGIQNIYRAECLAIYRAIKITNHKNISVNIYTDCKSAYQAIKKTHNHETIISLNTNSRDVLDAIDNEISIRDRLNLYKNIEWTQSHNGTPGNEEANKWAKIALELNNENYPEIDEVKFSKNNLAHNGQPILHNISDIIQQIQEVKYIEK